MQLGRHKVVRVLVVVVAVVAIFTGCWHFRKSVRYPGAVLWERKTPGQSEAVSMIALLANPTAYDGKKVSIVGYVAVEFECQAIFLDKGSYDHHIANNSIELNHDFEKQHIRAASHKHCRLEGVFNAPQAGFIQLRSGAIGDISRFQIWE